MRVTLLRQTPEPNRPGGASRPTHLPALDETLKRLPRDVGVVLLSLGVVGLVIPGPVPLGVPFLVAGAVFTWPGLVRRSGGCCLARFPALYALVNDQARRFQLDLERRYPGSTRRR